MTPTRRRRLYLVLGIVAGVAIAGGLALRAFQSNVTFFFDPSQVVAGKVAPGERFRLGGMVETGSLSTEAGTLRRHFVVTDYNKARVPVTYEGVLPDLFKENAGVVAHGRLQAGGLFVADEVLAKHDEKYMPPPVKRSLESQAAAGATPDVSTTVEK